MIYSYINLYLNFFFLNKKGRLFTIFFMEFRVIEKRCTGNWLCQLIQNLSLYERTFSLHFGIPHLIFSNSTLWVCLLWRIWVYVEFPSQRFVRNFYLYVNKSGFYFDRFFIGFGFFVRVYNENTTHRPVILGTYNCILCTSMNTILF